MVELEFGHVGSWEAEKIYCRQLFDAGSACQKKKLRLMLMHWEGLSG